MKNTQRAPVSKWSKALALVGIPALECYASLHLWQQFNYGDLRALQLLWSTLALALAIGGGTGFVFPRRSWAYAALYATTLVLLLFGVNEVMPLLQVLAEYPLEMWLHPWGWGMVLLFGGLLIGMTIGVSIALLVGLLAGKALAHATWCRPFNGLNR